MNDQGLNEIPSQLQPLLYRTVEDDRFIVVMNCGVAGSGKTTLAKAIVKQFSYFKRLSVDELVAENHGLYGIDYPANEELYTVYLDEAATEFQRIFGDLLFIKQDMILDRSFYDKADRVQHKEQIEEAGGRAVLVYFNPIDTETLWARIQERSKADRDANSAFVITRETFEKYCGGFDVPLGEGEIILNIA